MSVTALEILIGAAENASPSLFEIASSITGSIPDIIAAADIIRSWWQAQDGLQYEGHAFAISGAAVNANDNQTAPTPASGTRGRTSGRRPQQLHSADPTTPSSVATPSPAQELGIPIVPQDS